MGLNIQIEHEKYVCIAIISLIHEYVIWKWHIFQIDLMHSPENSKSGHFMSPGQDIKRPKYAIFLTEICLSFSNIICFWICDLQIMFCGYFALHSLMKMKKIDYLSLSCLRDKKSTFKLDWSVISIFHSIKLIYGVISNGL